MKKLIILCLLLSGCIVVNNSGYDQARVAQDGKTFTDLVDTKAAVDADATVKDNTARDNNVSMVP